MYVWFSFLRNYATNVIAFRVNANASCGQEYVMGALSTKTVILVSHQVDFLPAFDSVLVSTVTFLDVLL